MFGLKQGLKQFWCFRLLRNACVVAKHVRSISHYDAAGRKMLGSSECLELRLHASVAEPFAGRRRGEIFSSLCRLMGSADGRVASDAACVVGNFAFNDEGRYLVSVHWRACGEGRLGCLSLLLRG